MIAEYELALIGQIMLMEPSVKQIQFTKEFGSVYQMSAFLQYPAVVIERNLDRTVLQPKSYDFETEEGLVKFFLATIQYRMRIWHESFVKTLSLVYKERFFIEKNPYVPIPIDDETVKIGMRLIYCGMEEERIEDDKKGALRSADAVWESTVPISEEETVALIKSVKIGINGEFEIEYE
jgi:hypothetical protein